MIRKMTTIQNIPVLDRRTKESELFITDVALFRVGDHLYKWKQLSQLKSTSQTGPIKSGPGPLHPAGPVYI